MEQNGKDSEPKPFQPLLGSIPRKKLPPLPSNTASGVPAMAAPPTSARPVDDARHRLFKKPRHKLPMKSLPVSSASRPEAASAKLSSSSAQESMPFLSTPSISDDTILLISKDPLVLRIRTKGMDWSHGIRPKHRASLRMPKRGRVSYNENDDDDVEALLLRHDEDDLLMTETEDEDEVVTSPAKKKRRLVPFRQEQTNNHPEGSSVQEASASFLNVGVVNDAVPMADMILDSPPPGVLSTLWYSREVFLNVFVLEKIYSWKTRTSFSLVDAEGNHVDLPLDEATRIQARLLACDELLKDSSKRLEVSRLVVTKCPLILAIAAEQARLATEADNTTPKYILKAGPREECLLIKWRGRSHMHCSWERASDLARLDPSNNNTAKNKIRRYYQNQEITLGMEWKKVMEEERNLATTIHTHGTATAEDEEVASDDFFSPQCLEVERIMFCDETEMNMDVLGKQRAINLRTFRQPNEDNILISRIGGESRTPEDSVESDGAVRGVRKLARELLQATIQETPWDPEDNVRYVVKWKGLPYSEMTWEYWRDIKRDAVEEAEDYWYRQRAPDVEKAIEMVKKPHPNIRDFRKLDGSATYGKSSRERPIINANGSVASANDEEDEESTNGFRLRSYQLEGVNWLLFNWWNRRSCILADEMGLGKTIQSAAFLQELQTQPSAQIRGPFLIVAPLSLISQWESELKSWAPDLNAVLYHGSADARDFLVQHEFYYTEPFVSKQEAAKLRKNFITKFHVLITTYEVVLKDSGVLSKIKWRTLIVDEAHRLKNSKSKLFEELANVPRDYCVLLTGTPIANDTSELWALLHFANPAVFHDKDDFLEKFGQMTDVKQVDALHSLLRPFLLRRVKEDVEKSLPPKEETILEVSLTPIQKTFYKAIYERNTAFLYRGSKPSNAPSLMNVMMELRKCCNHPYLVKGAEDRIVSEAAAKLQGEAGGSSQIKPVDQGKLFAEQLIKSSGKMVLLDKLLRKLFVDGHKVLIFSQMVRVLDLIEELSKMNSYRYERLDGSTSSSSRSHAVDRFNRKSLKRFVMLLSTRAGGLGLNLTAADIVIIYDSDWNPQNDLQAMARAHRIGQTRAVQVFRLLTAKTYEMHMFHSASMKLGLERAVLSQSRDQSTGDESDIDVKSKKKADREQQAREIDELLKKGAYDVFRDEDDKEAEKFMETDIDQLLELASKKVVYGDADTSSLGSGLGSFSKASFVATTDAGEKDVDLDDPDFWSKAVGLEVPTETPEEIAQMIDDGVKRSRKQVQVYDPYAEVAEAEQMRRDRIALEKLMEKEEKERLKLEKKQRALELKARKKREQEEQNVKLLSIKEAAKVPTLSKEVAKMNKISSAPIEAKPKKSKKSDRQLALKRAENEDPPIERLKQGWEVPQRAKATAAALRFGFGRFCKLRNESNLSSLPLQDLEIFIRCYVYQIGLQAAYMLMARLPVSVNFDHLRALFQEWLGVLSAQEVEWISESIRDVLSFQTDVEEYRRMLRMPAILAEPVYLELLRNGAAFRALRRMCVLSRLNRFIEDCVDAILETLGHEELGKRGCSTHDLAYLDLDLKARYVSTEELSLAISKRLRLFRVREPASWWDRSCDIGLLIGSFVHGLGNYETMRNDFDLPFAQKLRRLVNEDELCKDSMDSFRTAAAAVRKTFDDALEAGRIKAELEVQAAVAAAAKTASQREEDAANLRKGGAEAEAAAKNMPRTQVKNAFEYDGTDSHFVTLTRMQSNILEAVRRGVPSPPLSSENECEMLDGIGEDHNGDTSAERLRDHQRCPFPDARVLDHRLLLMLKVIEDASASETELLEESNPDLWHKSDDCLTNILISREILPLFISNSADYIAEFNGIGIGGNQCGTSHRTLNDGCDYGFGSATQQLSQVAYGTDAPRYLRALGVPMNITRFAISALLHADEDVVQKLLDDEKLRYFGSNKDLALMQALGGVITSNEEKVTTDQSEQATDSAKESESVTVQPLQSADFMKPDISIPNSMTATSVCSSDATVFDISDRIPLDFRLNAKLRASVCMAVLFYGFPTEDPLPLGEDFRNWHVAHAGGSDMAPAAAMFSNAEFRSAVRRLAPDVDVPDEDVVRQYVVLSLLPHCVRLCVNGNGPVTRGARGSEGKYETAYGISLHPEPTALHPSPLPDPCMSLQEHSMEALGYANAILRRVRLLRSCQYICSEETGNLASLEQLVRSKPLSAIRAMPVWWCPWLHDVGLIIHAATNGLFSLVVERNSDSLFASNAIEELLRSNLATASHRNVPPAARNTDMEDLNSWVRRQAQDFPTVYQLERRLAFLCGRATADCVDGHRFDCIPMFDHGGWPRD